jgi:hypothetical protein
MAETRSERVWFTRARFRHAARRRTDAPRPTTAPTTRRMLIALFREWYARPIDLPGTYYLQVVQWLFKDNQLATGRFAALGRLIDLSRVSCPIFLLAAHNDEIVALNSYLPRDIWLVVRGVKSGKRSWRARTSGCSWERPRSYIPGPRSRAGSPRPERVCCTNCRRKCWLRVNPWASQYHFRSCRNAQLCSA